jgi:Fe-S-cluster containining protein
MLMPVGNFRLDKLTNRVVIYPLLFLGIRDYRSLPGLEKDDGLEEAAEDNTALIDCQAGRELGCATFCCRLHVRLNEAERARFEGAGTLEKNEDGLCTYIDKNTFRCTIWDQRPGVCREYTCNDDSLLQVVIREGFTNLKTLVTSQIFIPKEIYVYVPTENTEE